MAQAGFRTLFFFRLSANPTVATSCTTRDNIKDNVKAFFENNVYYSEDDFNNSIQDGYDEIVAFSGCVLRAISIPFTANLSYYDMLTLIPDYLGVVAIFNSTTRKWMLPTNVRKLDNDRVDWETALGTPYYFAPVSHRFVTIYKKPGTVNYGNMYVFYRGAADTLSADACVLIPEDYTKTLEDYSIADLLEQNQEWGKAGVHLEAYQETLEQLRVMARNKRIPDRLSSLK